MGFITPPHTQHSGSAWGWFAHVMRLWEAGGITVAGLALIAAGVAWIGGLRWIAVALIGGVTLVAGLFDLCIFSALLDGPQPGSAIRPRPLTPNRLLCLGVVPAPRQSSCRTVTDGSAEPGAAGHSRSRTPNYWPPPKRWTPPRMGADTRP